MGLAEQLITKALGIEKIEDPNVAINRQLEKEISIKEKIIQNQIKLKALSSVTEEELNNVLNSIKLDEFISSMIQVEITKFMKSRSSIIVREALDDFEDTYKVKSTIKDYCVETISKAFSVKKV